MFPLLWDKIKRHSKITYRRFVATLWPKLQGTNFYFSWTNSRSAVAATTLLLRVVSFGPHNQVRFQKRKR